MSDLVSAVPPHEPSDDVLTYAAKAVLGSLPVLGALAAETFGHAVSTRQAEKRHAFDVLVATTLTDTISRLNRTLTVEDVIGSDSFITAVTRAQRAAAETASEEKRRRLAFSVAHAGGWAPFSASERAQFTRLIDDLDELHVFLLHYFNDPAEWLKAHDLLEDRFTMDGYFGSIQAPLTAALGTPEFDWRAPVAQVAEDLKRNGLAEVPLTTIMGGDGVLAQRTTDKGRRFLDFVGEPPSVEAVPPAAN